MGLTAAWDGYAFGHRRALSWGAAALLHVLAALVLLRLGDRQPISRPDAQPRPAFSVRLVPAAPQPAAGPRAQSHNEPPRMARPAMPIHVPIHVPPPVAVEGAPAAAAASSAAPDSGGEGRVDRAAALETAREFARDLKAPPGERRLTTDERLGQAIDRARRPDCRKAYAGAGTLAPLLWARDAVLDAGCKW
jgi:hypothetical protein